MFITVVLKCNVERREVRSHLKVSDIALKLL